VLGPREAPGAHLVAELAHGGDHRRAQVRVALGEAGRVAVVDPQQIVEDQHLTVGCRPGADPDHRHGQAGHDLGGDGRRDRLEDDRKAARLLELERVLGHLQGTLGGATLRAVAPE